MGGHGRRPTARAKPLAAMMSLLLGATMGHATAQGAPSTAPGWALRPPMPTMRLEMASAVVGDRVVVIGGLDGDGGTLATVEVYDAATDTWTSGPEHPVPIHHPMAAALDGALYVAGGFGPGGAATRRVHRLGPAGWEPVARLPLARAAGVMVALGGRLLLAGGVDLEGDVAREMLAYDPGSDAWSVLDGPPTPREHLGGAVVDGRFLTVGGRVARQHLGNVEAWDPVTAAWQQLPDLPTPRAGLGVTATCDGGLVAIGGEDIRGVADGTFPHVEAWDPVAGMWSPWQPLPAGRHGVAVASVGPIVLVIGGGTQAGLSASDTVEAVDITGRPGCAGIAPPP
jgi:non-specific serine/threonine protein kinase